MMTVRHTLRSTGICPVNGDEDDYLIVVDLRPRRVSEALLVEDVIEVVGQLLREPVLQEAFTAALARHLRADVTTHCRHGEVETEVRCERPKGDGRGMPRLPSTRKLMRQGMLRYMTLAADLTDRQREVYRMARRKGLTQEAALEMARGGRDPQIRGELPAMGNRGS